jgi:hypothetical protein
MSYLGDVARKAEIAIGVGSQESESAIKIHKKFMTPKNKKVEKKVNGNEKKTARSQALEKEAKRYKAQRVAIRAKYKSGLEADLKKAQSLHKTKVEAIKKGVKQQAPAQQKSQ